MELFGRHVVVHAGRKNAPLRAWLERWEDTVEAAAWLNLLDVRKAFPSADGVKLRPQLVVTVFNVKGNQYRLIANIDYDLQTVEALAVLTHAEYSKGAWKEKY